MNGYERGSVLEVDALTVTAGGVTLVEDVSFALGRGERVGLIGESGSGKSLTATALMGLLPDDLRAGGSVRLATVDHDLIDADEHLRSTIRGGQMTMVFQEPMTALNPLMRVGAQVAEVFRIHGTEPDRRAASAAAARLLARVDLPDPERMARRYPHQLSGGQRQRVMLAMALANGPDVLICDEPTTALDVTVQARMLQLIVEGVADRGAALLFITHDLAVVATVCERVLVMYGGRIVEAGPVADVFTRPGHPYTRGLLDSSDLEAVDPHGRLPTIPGGVPAGGRFPDGCVFRNRCFRAEDTCATWPGWTGDPHRGYACWFPLDDADAGDDRG